MNTLQVNHDASISHDLYMERLDALTEKTLADIKAFSMRENIPYDQNSTSWTPGYVRGLLTPESIHGITVRNILLTTSQVLESLQTAAGVQSFVLAVNPYDAGDEGFLGGTPLGRDFWRNLRGGGTAGAKALKSLAVSTLQSTSSSSSQKDTAHSVKSEVYARVRNLLRTTSGVRNAEMKWTNHDNVNVYGVRLEGWPTSIPMQNPSSLSTSQNRLLRDALICGTLRFCRINPEGSTSDGGNTSCGPVGSSSDLSWAIAEEFNPPVPHDIDTGRVAYQGESGDYFPGRRHSTGGGVEEGLIIGDEMDGGQLPSKRQRLDDG
ncbi:hypothetical protein BGW80DRAFT_1313037 [Lactifluus volemus]|nr:hypothetical protein BGW80DRAFT_1313037 [Lactifluus volemus]